jgi:hypothetical protein
MFGAIRDRLFYEAIPRPALGTLANPTRRNVTAGLANELSFSFGHNYYRERIEDYNTYYLIILIFRVDTIRSPITSEISYDPDASGKLLMVTL